MLLRDLGVFGHYVHMSSDSLNVFTVVMTLKGMGTLIRQATLSEIIVLFPLSEGVYH